MSSKKQAILSAMERASISGSALVGDTMPIGTVRNYVTQLKAHYPGMTFAVRGTVLGIAVTCTNPKTIQKPAISAELRQKLIQAFAVFVDDFFAKEQQQQSAPDDDDSLV